MFLSVFFELCFLGFLFFFEFLLLVGGGEERGSSLVFLVLLNFVLKAFLSFCFFESLFFF